MHTMLGTGKQSKLKTKSIHIRILNLILFYHPKKLLYQLYYIILQYTHHPKILLFYHLIKILFFNLFLLLLFQPSSFLFSKSTIPSFSKCLHFQRSSCQFFFLFNFFSISIYFQLFHQPTNFFFNLFPTISTTANFFFFDWERTCQISTYLNLPTLKIHIHIYSIKPVKYWCKIHIHIYRCILSNINVFNLPILMIQIHTHTHTHTHTHIYIYRTCQFFFFFSFFLRKNLPNINLLKLANFKNLHTYI